MININDSHLHFACAIIIGCPLIWNILGRLCYACIPAKTPTYQRYIVCYILMLWIFSFSSYRDYLVRQTIINQPRLILLDDYTHICACLAIVIGVLGQILVLSSFYRLGLTGTFLGDYCGILMNEPVRTFPFNVCNHPMYTGSTITFLGLTVYYQSPVGILLTIEIYLVYRIAVIFEEPYTQWIYEQKKTK
jgi:phosphatidylethanolamine/phosphatidyl-N-methylethanolamine N-methyltransferase